MGHVCSLHCQSGSETVDGGQICYDYCPSGMSRVPGVPTQCQVGGGLLTVTASGSCASGYTYSAGGCYAQYSTPDRYTPTSKPISQFSGSDVCPAGTKYNGAGLCYKPCKGGYSLTALTCNINRTPPSTATSCPDTNYPTFKGGLCYASCKTGYSWDGVATCNLKRTALTPAATCPSDYPNRSGLCYQNCKAGYKWDGVSTCNLLRYALTPITNFSGAQICPSDKPVYQAGASLCYPGCGPGYRNTIPSMCQRDATSFEIPLICPTGYTMDTARTVCVK